jgi:preprotein translocase SecF subunit
MALVRYFPENAGIGFMAFRKPAFILSVLAMIGSLAIFFVHGLNLGIDFQGGTLIEIRTTDGPADLSQIRANLAELELGDVEVQTFGAPNDVLIRLEAQEGGDGVQQAVLDEVKLALNEMAIDYRRVEVVGPRISSELAEAGAIAVIAALLAILVYIWLRFEWHFALGAVLATLHDVILTLGFFSITDIEFNLSSIAAILTIVGYSLNDTVVVYDRVRENLRKYKTMPMPDLLNNSINEMLTRTIMTSLTTLLVLISLFAFGGEVVRSFTAAMIWGVVIGTYSSVFIAGPLLIILNLRGEDVQEDKLSASK